MLRKFLRSKIHRATVTQADLHYEGSLTLPPDLMLAAGIAPFESVHVWDVTRGTRLETYAILGEEGSSPRSFLSTRKIGSPTQVVKYRVHDAARLGIHPSIRVVSSFC